MMLLTQYSIATEGLRRGGATLLAALLSTQLAAQTVPPDSALLRSCEGGLRLFPRNADLVDPELRQMMPLLAGVGGESADPPTQTSIAAARDRLKKLGEARARMLPPPRDGVTVSERFVPGAPGDPDVRVLIYSPADARSNQPALLDIHGGAFVMGAAEDGARTHRSIAAQLGAVVVSVDYRLAPENPWPAAVEDSYAALQWMYDNAAALNIDPGKIVVGGSSAGGAIAAAVALMARDRGKIPLRGQLLIYPSLDDRSYTAADPHCEAGTAPDVTAAYKLYLGETLTHGEVSPYAFAARAASLEELPPTFLAVGAVDGLADQGIAYARRLIWSGVQTELNVYPGAYHGFNLVTEAKVTKKFDGDVMAALRRFWR
jgi:acetyl esterase/lipase